MLEKLEYILFDQKSGEVTLNRPEVHNAFNAQYIEEITKVFNYIESNKDSFKCIILKANGKSFSAGADLNWMKSMIGYSLEENKIDSYKMAEMFNSINNLSIPLIGLVNGAALGGGTGIVACCDYVIASSRSKFGFTEVKLGLAPAVISSFVIKKIGYSNALSLFLSGEIFNGQKAYDIGLVHKVVSEDEFDSSAIELIKLFSSNGFDAMRVSKKLVKDVHQEISNYENKNHKRSVEFCVEEISKLRISSEAQEGMNALLEKRKPNWNK